MDTELAITQDVGRDGFFQDLSPLFVDDHLLPPSSHDLHSVTVS